MKHHFCQNDRNEITRAMNFASGFHINSYIYSLKLYITVSTWNVWLGSEYTSVKEYIQNYRWSKISAIWLVEIAYIFLIFLIATLQILMECETLESWVGYSEHLNPH